MTFSNAMSFVKTIYSLAEFVLLLPFCYISFFLAHSRLHTNKHSIHSICDYEQTFFLLSLLLNRNIALMNLQMSIHLHLEIILFYHNRKCQHKMSNFIKVEVESKAFRWLCQTENIVFFLSVHRKFENFFFHQLLRNMKYKHQKKMWFFLLFCQPARSLHTIKRNKMLFLHTSHFWSVRISVEKYVFFFGIQWKINQTKITNESNEKENVTQIEHHKKMLLCRQIYSHSTILRGKKSCPCQLVGWNSIWNEGSKSIGNTVSNKKKQQHQQ